MFVKLEKHIFCEKDINITKMLQFQNNKNVFQ